MPKYWVTNYFAHGSFPEVGQKQKMEEKKERKRERKKDRPGGNKLKDMNEERYRQGNKGIKWHRETKRG